MVTKKKPISLTEVQEAVIELRRNLNLTQQMLALQMGKAMMTVSRWERFRPPTGRSLEELESFARRVGQIELARVFQGARWAEEHDKEMKAATWGGWVRPAEGPYSIEDPAEAIGEVAGLLRVHTDRQAVQDAYRRLVKAALDSHGVLVKLARESKVKLSSEPKSEYLEELRRSLERIYRSAQETQGDKKGK